jgi:hypothetical protein
MVLLFLLMILISCCLFVIIVALMLRVVWLRILVSLMVLLDSLEKILAYNIFQGFTSVNINISDEFISVSAVYPLDIKSKDVKELLRL